MFETLGLGVDFQFRHSGKGDLYAAMADMNKLYNTAGMTADQLEQLGGSFDTFVTGIKDVGKSMMTAGAGLTATSAFAINKAAQYESAFTGIMKYMSDTSVEGIRTFNEELSAQAKYLGITKTEILGATQEYMAMGLAQEKALEMASSVSYAAQIWDVLPQEAASAFKAISAAYNMDFLVQDTRDEFIDMINYVADNTALVGSEALNFLAAAGSNLQLLGRTTMDGALAMGAAASVAQVDMTHFGYAMTRISRNYQQEGAEIFKSIGIDVRDATGALMPMNEALDLAADRLKTLDLDTQSNFATKLAQVYSGDLLRMLGGWSEYEKTMQVIASGQYAGSAAAEWEKITGTLNYNLNVTKVIWDDFIQNTFGQLLPILSKIVGGINKVFGVITEWLGKHPLIGKFVAGFIALAGVTLLLGGAFVFFASKAAILAATLQPLGGLSAVLSGGFKGFGAILSGLGPVISGFTKKALSLSLTMGALYFLWKYDIFGIRGILEQFTTDVKVAFETSQELIKKNAVSIKTELGNMDVSNDFVDKLTAFLTRISLVWNGLVELLSNDWTLSDEMYKKLDAAGVLGVVTKIAMVIYRLQLVWEGFKEGFANTATAIRNIFTSILMPVWNVFGDAVMWLIDRLTDLLLWLGFIDKDSTLLDANAEKWKKFGEALGIVAAVIMTYFSVARVISMFLKPVKALSGGLSLIGSIGDKMGKAGKATSGLPALMGSVGSAGSTASLVPKASTVVRAMEDIAIILGGFTLIVLAYATLSKIPGFNQFVSSGIKTLGILVNGLMSVILQIAALGALAVIAGNIPTATVTRGLQNGAMVLGGFTLIISAYALLSKIPGFNDFISSGGQTLGTLMTAMNSFVSVGFLAMVVIIAGMSYIPVSSVGAGFQSLAGVLAGFTIIIAAYGALALIPGINDFMTNGGVLIGSLTNAMNAFISPGFIVMTVAVAAMGMLSPATFVSGMIGLATVLGGFTILISAFGALKMIPGFDEFIQGGGETMAMLFYQIGQAFGSLVGGAMEGISSGLPAVGENLSLFATNATPFFTAITGVNFDGIAKFTSAFATLVLALAGDKVVSLITGETDLPKLGTDLSEFGNSAAGFFEAVAAYPQAGVTKASGVFESITNLGGYATKSGGLAQMFTGTTDLPKLGDDLTEFGTAASGFFTTAASIPQNGIDKSKGIFEALQGIAGYEFKTGGMAQWFTGTTNLEDIGNQMTTFGNNVQGFFVMADGVSYSSLEKGKRIFEVLKDIAGYEFKSDGLAQVFTGEVDLVNIGTQLTSFGYAILGFFSVSGNISADAIENGRLIFVAIQDIGEFIGSNVLSGDGLADMGTGLTNFANNAVGFFTTMASVDIDGVNSVVLIMTDFFKVFTNSNAAVLNTIATSLTDVANALLNLSNTVTQNSSIMYDAINNVFNFVDPLLPHDGNAAEGVFSTLTGDGSNIITTISQGITDNGDLIRTTFVTVLNNTANVLPGRSEGPMNYTSLYTSGRSIMTTIASGVNANSSLIKTAVTSALNKATAVLPHSDAPEGPFSDLSGSGRAIPETIAQGIRANASVVKTALGNLDNSISTNVDGSVSLVASSSGVNGILSDITVVFVDILSISRGIYEYFARIPAAVPSYTSPSYADRMNAVYDNRVDTNNINNNNDGMTVVFQAGAFQINITANNPNEVMSAIPQLQENLEATVVDIVSKLKDERYEY